MQLFKSLSNLFSGENMSLKKTIAFLFLILFSVVAANAQKSYKSAASKVRIAGKTIVAKSSVYINLMPGVMDENQGKTKQICSETGSLIAPFLIETNNNSSLPKGIQFKSIWIKNNGFWWSNTPNKAETETKENSISSVARACPSSKLTADKPIKVVIQVTYKGKSYFISSNQTKLEKVY